jgi:hypothetical protein
MGPFARPEVAHLEENSRKAPSCGVSRYAAAIDTASYDCKVVHDQLRLASITKR